MSERYLGGPMLVVGPAIKTGMPIRMDNPREVGADRLVNAVAAYERFQRHLRRGRLRDCDHLRRGLGGRRVPGRDHHPRGRDLDRRAVRARGQAAQGRAGRAPLADRQVDRRRDPQRGSPTASRVRWRGSSAACAASSATTSRSSLTGGLAQVLVPFISRDDRRGRRPAHPDRAAADLRAQRRPERRLQIGARRDRARPACGPRSRRGSGSASRRRSLGSRRRWPHRTRRAGPRIAANTGASSISVGTSQASRARASISGPDSLPRIVAIVPSMRNSATRSSSTCGACSRSPTAGPAGPAAARRRRSAATARRRSSGSAAVDRPACRASASGTRPTSRAPVGRVGGEQDLARGHQREQGLQVGGHPPRGVEQQVGVVGGDPPDPATGRRCRRGRG